MKINLKILCDTIMIKNMIRAINTILKLIIYKIMLRYSQCKLKLISLIIRII